MSFAKNIVKNLCGKYGKKFLDKAKKSNTNAIKTASKRAIQETPQATGDLIGNKIADKITNVSKNSPKNTVETEIERPKEKYISSQKRQQITDELRLEY